MLVEVVVALYLDKHRAQVALVVVVLVACKQV
jgi:hypothetical protein